MTDLQARLVAAMQQVRTSTPRECDERCGRDSDHTDACWERSAARVDARLAACVEAAIEATIWPLTDDEQSHERADALAAFLAAAAQEETT